MVGVVAFGVNIVGCMVPSTMWYRGVAGGGSVWGTRREKAQDEAVISQIQMPWTITMWPVLNISRLFFLV